jgi:hypothetical protein
MLGHAPRELAQSPLSPVHVIELKYSLMYLGPDMYVYFYNEADIAGCEEPNKYWSIHWLTS